MARASAGASTLAGCPCSSGLHDRTHMPSFCTSRVCVQGPVGWKRGQVHALIAQPSDSTSDNVGDFVKRMEQAWLISKQPRPVQCVSCEASGQAECAWCKGTGFFTLGDNMLCEVPSRNTSCRVCFGQGSLPCDDCKGTGYRARWLGDPSRKPFSENRP